MTTIGVIADTHIKPGGKRQLPREVFDAFEGVDLILHAGDLNYLQVVTDLEALAPVLAVYGNNCDWEAVHSLPATREMQIEECLIGLVHGDVGQGSGTSAKALSHFLNADCVIFGHSHLPLIRWRDIVDPVRGERHVLLFNPGSATTKRRAEHFTCGILRVDGKHLDPQIIAW